MGVIVRLVQQISDAAQVGGQFLSIAAHAATVLDNAGHGLAAEGIQLMFSGHGGDQLREPLLTGRGALQCLLEIRRDLGSYSHNR